MRVTVAMVGSGTGTDQFRAPLPTSHTIAVHVPAKQMVVDIPDAHAPTGGESDGDWQARLEAMHAAPPGRYAGLKRVNGAALAISLVAVAAQPSGTPPPSAA